MIETEDTVVTYLPESSVGPWAKNLRRSLRLTQQELAEFPGVSRREVSYFEHNLPVQVRSRIKLVRELWAARKVSW